MFDKLTLILSFKSLFDKIKVIFSLNDTIVSRIFFLEKQFLEYYSKHHPQSMGVRVCGG